jgi:hypothetical protein
MELSMLSRCHVWTAYTVLLQCPSNSGSQFWNYKGTSASFSFLLMPMTALNTLMLDFRDVFLMQEFF